MRSPATCRRPSPGKKPIRRVGAVRVRGLHLLRADASGADDGARRRVSGSSTAQDAAEPVDTANHAAPMPRARTRGMGRIAPPRTSLRRLDAYSFFIVPADSSCGGDVVVVGTTGAFLIKACGLSGVAVVKGRRPVVGDGPSRACGALRAGASGWAPALSCEVDAGGGRAIVCLTEAIAPAVVDAAGVRFVKVSRYRAGAVGAARRAVPHQSPERCTRAGVQVAGDQRRHFAVRH